MKKIVLSLLMLLGVAVTQVQAKTIHWLTFIDTTDPNVGVYDQNTRKILYARWIDLVNASLKEQGYNVDVIDVYGSKTTPENCKKTLNDFDCEAGEDIVVFYYVGHGTENTGTSKFPLMLMASNDVNKFIPHDWVHNKLKSLNPRLTVTISMCCNARQGAPGRIAPTFSPNYGNAYMDQAMSEKIKKIFLDYTGDIKITSATPPESSYACKSDIGLTDYFTYHLLLQFNNILLGNGTPDWSEMMEQVKRNVYRDVQRDDSRVTQTPYWESNLTQAIRPSVTPPTPPVQEPTSSDDKTVMKTKLERVLSFISSTKVSDAKREEMADKLETSLPRNLIVRIMSQDGNVVVDKESISTFLGRISTSSLLMNVSVVDFDINQAGKIGMLKVREVYKKKK